MLKKIVPHIIAAIIFAIVSMIFFAPQYSNKYLRQGDMVQVSGMAQDVVEHIEKYDEHPQWMGRMFGGMPPYLVTMNYEGRFIPKIMKGAYFLGQPTSLMFVAMAMFYLMLMMFGVKKTSLAILGGLAYGLSTYFPIIIEAGHITKMMAMAWMPALIGAIYYAYNKNKWLGATLAALFASVEISSSHYQITYYFLFVIVALVISELIKAYKYKTLKKYYKTTIVLAVAAVLALGSNFTSLYYVATHSTHTIRGKAELTINKDNTNKQSNGGLDKEYATAWSYGKAETFNLFIPNFKGQSSGSGFESDGEVARSLQKYGASHIAPNLSSYWGEQPFTEGPVYIGAAMIFLFILALFILEKSQKWWLIAPMILALLLAWGNNLMWFTELFLNYFPLYNKFRVPSMILVILQLAIPTLAILGLNKIAQNKIEKTKIIYALKYSAIITGGFALLCAIILPLWMDFSAANDAQMGLPKDVIEAMQIERAELLRKDAWRTLLIVLLTATTIWSWVNKKIKPIYAIGILIIISTIDLFSVDRRYVAIEDFHPAKPSQVIQMTDNDRVILQDTTNYRVVNMTVNPFNEATTSYFHRSVGGYHAAKLRRYQDLIDFHLSQGNMNVYNMLNTKYFIEQEGVKTNSDAMGSAWFVDSVIYVKNPNEEIMALGKEEFNPKIAIVNKNMETNIPISKDTTNKIKLISYKVNELIYESKSSQEATVIFSEIYYPDGWIAYINDVKTPYFRANYVLRAMRIPKGKSIIKWKFEAPNFKLVTNITIIFSLLILIPLIYFVALEIFKTFKTK